MRYTSPFHLLTAAEAQHGPLLADGLAALCANHVAYAESHPDRPGAAGARAAAAACVTAAQMIGAGQLRELCSTCGPLVQAFTVACRLLGVPYADRARIMGGQAEGAE